jgi:hypothetical protein
MFDDMFIEHLRRSGRPCEAVVHVRRGDRFASEILPNGDDCLSEDEWICVMDLLEWVLDDRVGPHPCLRQRNAHAKSEVAHPIEA